MNHRETCTTKPNYERKEPFRKEVKQMNVYFEVRLGREITSMKHCISVWK